MPAALSGAAACLFTREIADLRHFSPRIHRVFGWFALAFVLLAVANLAKFIGLGPMVATIGNAIFLIVAAFTLVTVFIAWRRGNRASGWFLIAWGLLEIFTIATTLSWLLTDSAGVEFLLYFGLPLSMVGAAVLIALGVADRLREQRAALTGVLNRRSLLERLVVCQLRCCLLISIISRASTTRMAIQPATLAWRRSSAVYAAKNSGRNQVQVAEPLAA